MAQPSSTTIQRKHVNKCKNTRNTPYNQEEWCAAEISSKRRLGEDEHGDEKKKREEEEKVTELISSSLISLAYIKQEKAKSKIILTLGRNYTNVPRLLPTIKTSLIAL